MSIGGTTKPCRGGRTWRRTPDLPEICLGTFCVLYFCKSVDVIMRTAQCHLNQVTTTLHDIVARYRLNASGFYKEYRWLFAAFVIALLCDAASTSYFISMDGWEEELHPLFQLLARFCGPVIGPLLGAILKAITGYTIAVYWRRYATVLFVAPTLISLWAAWYNVWGINLYVPNFLMLYHQIASF